MLAKKVDGCDFFATYEVMAEVIQYCREGRGPVAVEFDTERFFGHYEGDPQRYRGNGEVDRLRETRDCLVNFRTKTLADGSMDVATLDAIDAQVMELIEEAVEEARAAPPPNPSELLDDVYVTY
jgi:pyruvate dehydrogenase E1 component alpha subunit